MWKYSSLWEAFRNNLIGAEPVLHSWNDWKTRGVPCRKPPKERVATVVTTAKDDITMDESASVSNPEVMEIIEPDGDYNDNNNVNNDDIIWKRRMNG